MKNAVDQMGGLDAVVSNAGCASPGKLTHLDPGDWDRVFAVNVRGLFQVTRAAGEDALISRPGPLRWGARRHLVFSWCVRHSE